SRARRSETSSQNRGPGPGMNINVHIERLILDGLPVATAQGALVQAGLENELTRLLAANGLKPQIVAGGALSMVEVGSLSLPSHDTPTQLGRRIARAVAGGLNKAQT